MAGELWVDFSLLKKSVSIKDVLAHYGLLEKFQAKGDRLTGPCPIHHGTHAKQFSVSLKKNAFKCFSGDCEAHGNQIDLVAALEKVSFRDAALMIQGWFGITPRESARKQEGEAEAQGAREAAANATAPTATPSMTGAPSADSPAPAAVEENKVLGFELKLDAAHPYLTERGLTPETVAYFGLGLASRGSMKDRIAIPIHSENGELVAYAGRWVGKDADLPPGEGKYKLPPGFHKSLVVYNLHRVPAGTKRVVLVEGFFSVFWLHQNGWPNAVSVMGSSFSPTQIRLLAERFKGIELFLDGDEAGEEAARKIAVDFALRTWVKIIACPKGLQPDRLPAHELKRLLS